MVLCLVIGIECKRSHSSSSSSSSSDDSSDSSSSSSSSSDSDSESSSDASHGRHRKSSRKDKSRHSGKEKSTGGRGGTSTSIKSTPITTVMSSTSGPDKSTASSSTYVSKHSSSSKAKTFTPSPERSGGKSSLKKHDSKQESRLKTSDKRQSPEREKRRERSASRDRYESKRHDKDRDRRDRDNRDRDSRSSKYQRSKYDDDRHDKYSSRDRHKDDKRDRRDKYKRDYDKDRRSRRSSSRDRKRRSSTEKNRRKSPSRSKTPTKSYSPTKPPTPQVAQHIPPPLVQGFVPGPKPLIPAMATPANIPSLMDLQVAPPPDLALRQGLGNDLPIDPAATLSRNSLIRSNVKAAQLEKMGIDVLQQSKKASEAVPLPSYYNPGAVNPVRYADQVQKRKLLWSHKTAESKDVTTNISKWEQAAFSQDKDGKMASKFLRLMGVKDTQKTTPAAGETVGKPSSSGTGDSIKKQEELFSTMEQQYEVARQVTHTMRGVGLGFSSQPRTF